MRPKSRGGRASGCVCSRARWFGRGLKQSGQGPDLFRDNKQTDQTSGWQAGSRRLGRSQVPVSDHWVDGSALCGPGEAWFIHQSVSSLHPCSLGTLLSSFSGSQWQDVSCVHSSEGCSSLRLCFPSLTSKSSLLLLGLRREVITC